MNSRMVKRIILLYYSYLLLSFTESFGCTSELLVDMKEPWHKKSPPPFSKMLLSVAVTCDCSPPFTAGSFEELRRFLLIWNKSKEKVKNS